jgi:hypothetical protein
MLSLLAQWSHKSHDVIALLILGMATATLAEIDLWLKLVLTFLTAVFMLYGIIMRHKRLKGYRPPDTKGDDAT